MCNANKSDVSTKVDKCENQWFLSCNATAMGRPLKWTSAEINVLSCNAAERGVSTKVDKLK